MSCSSFTGGWDVWNRPQTSPGDKFLACEFVGKHQDSGLFVSLSLIDRSLHIGLACQQRGIHNLSSKVFSYSFRVYILLFLLNDPVFISDLGVPFVVQTRIKTCVHIPGHCIRTGTAQYTFILGRIQYRQV